MAVLKIKNADGTWTYLSGAGQAGAPGEPGAPGADGYTPIRGVDYWTEEDIEEMHSYIDDAILNGEW